MKRHKKLCLIVFSEDFEKVHYALVLASAAVATDRKATLFFTMGAIRAITGTPENPGWVEMPSSLGKGLHRDRDYAQVGVGTFEQLLMATAELGGTFMVCEMGLRAMGLTRNDLRPDLSILEGGVVTFLNDAETAGDLLFL